jgi:hypothetical protein
MNITYGAAQNPLSQSRKEQRHDAAAHPFRENPLVSVHNGAAHVEHPAVVVVVVLGRQPEEGAANLGADGEAELRENCVASGLGTGEIAHKRGLPARI